MTYETKQAYTEICDVLQYMPEEYVKKIPKKLINLFESGKLQNYSSNINKSNPLDKNNLSSKTLTLIAMLNYQYWCPNKKQKDNLFKIYSSNNEKYQRELEEKYNVDKLFEKRNRSISQDSVAMVEYKESIFIKLRRLLKNIFHK